MAVVDTIVHANSHRHSCTHTSHTRAHKHTEVHTHIHVPSSTQWHFSLKPDAIKATQGSPTHYSQSTPDYSSTHRDLGNKTTANVPLAHEHVNTTGAMSSHPTLFYWSKIKYRQQPSKVGSVGMLVPDVQVREAKVALRHGKGAQQHQGSETIASCKTNQRMPIESPKCNELQLLQFPFQHNFCHFWNKQLLVWIQFNLMLVRQSLCAVLADSTARAHTHTGHIYSNATCTVYSGLHSRAAYCTL